MHDGAYRICLTADGYEGRGRLDLADNRGHGHDGRYEVEVHVTFEAPTLTAVVAIRMDASAVSNLRVPDQYSLEMAGNGDDDSFTLIGIGPLGLIIELTGSLMR